MPVWHCAGLGLDSLFLRGKQNSAKPPYRGVQTTPQKVRSNLSFKILRENTPKERVLFILGLRL